jgi:predicted amidohydrolase
MLLAALNIPFDEALCDTQVFTARIDKAVAKQEFDILVLPSQPYVVSPKTFERRTHLEQSTRTLLRWLANLSARKHALIVCGTYEPARKQVLCRTALAAFNGQVIARHVKFPEEKAVTRGMSITKYMTFVDLPHIAQQASILLDEDLRCPIPLVTVTRSCMCLVSCISVSPSLLARARSVAVDFGVFVVLSVTSRPKLGLSSRAIWREIARGVAR